MKHLFVFFMLFMGFTFNAYSANFISSFEDIPLQDGFTEHEQLSFDTEDVRVIEQYISSSSVKKDEFIKFYDETLKSLGWKSTFKTANTLNFKRDDEILTITIEAEEPLLVLFSLKPTENKTK